MKKYLLLIGLIGLSLAGSVSASTLYWTGGASTNWSTAGNWSTTTGGIGDGAVPTVNDDVVFDGGTATSSTLTANAVAKSVTMNSTYATGTLAIGTYDLAVSGNVTIQGKVTIGNSASNGLTAVNLTIGAGGVMTSTATTYYNQVTVSGTLSPNAAGTYTAAGVNNGKPYYRRGSDNWFVWNRIASGNWVLSTAVETLTQYWTASSPILINPFTSNYNTTGTATVANVTASGIHYGPSASSIVTISGNYDQSSVTSKFVAGPSLITVNGNGSFTADGTLSSYNYDGATLVLNGTNTVTYTNNNDYATHGFYNLTVGQNTLTTRLASSFAILNTLTVGSGVITVTTGGYALELLGATPLNLNASSTISVTYLYFSGANITQTVPFLTNGYGCGMKVGNYNTGTVITQTGNIVLNTNNSLLINDNGYAIGSGQTWKTDGYNLTVGGNLQIGAGADSGLKKLDATNYTNPDANAKSTITVGGNWLNYGNGTAPSQFVADNSTVILNKTSGTQTVTSGATTAGPYPFNNLIHSGAGTLQMLDNMWVKGQWLNSAGTLNANGKTLSNNMMLMF